MPWHTDSWAIQSSQTPARMSHERLVPLAQPGLLPQPDCRHHLKAATLSQLYDTLGFSLPHPLSSKDVCLITHHSDKWHGVQKADHPHTLPLVCYFLSTPAEQREGRGARSAPAGDLHSPVPLTNYQPQRQEMRHNRNILTKASPSGKGKSSLRLQSREEKYFLKCLI